MCVFFGRHAVRRHPVAMILVQPCAAYTLHSKAKLYTLEASSSGSEVSLGVAGGSGQF